MKFMGFSPNIQVLTSQAWKTVSSLKKGDVLCRVTEEGFTSSFTLEEDPRKTFGEVDLFTVQRGNHIFIQLVGDHEVCLVSDNKFITVPISQVDFSSVSLWASGALGGSLPKSLSNEGVWEIQRSIQWNTWDFDVCWGYYYQILHQNPSRVCWSSFSPSLTDSSVVVGEIIDILRVLTSGRDHDGELFLASVYPSSGFFNLGIPLSELSIRKERCLLESFSLESSGMFVVRNSILKTTSIVGGEL